MSKIELPSIANPSNVSLMNSNFKKIEDALNEEVLYRKGYTGEPNEMETDLDLNGHKILNVATGTGVGDLVTKGYVDQQLALKYDKSGGPVSGDMQMQSHRITGLPNATQLSEPATYDQLLQVESAEDSLLRSDLAASSGSSIVGFLQAGVGSTPRTVQSKQRDVVSVKDFGAIGDGVVNDTAAIALADAAASAAGGITVNFPGGPYVFTGQPSAGVTWRFDGARVDRTLIGGSPNFFAESASYTYLPGPHTTYQQTAEYIRTLARGSENIGQSFADTALNIHIQKEHWSETSGTPKAGEIDGINITYRQGGPRVGGGDPLAGISSGGAMNINVQATQGSGASQIMEVVNTVVDVPGLTINRSIGAQFGILNTRDNYYYGMVYLSNIGSQTSAMSIQNTAGSRWNNIIENYVDGLSNFVLSDLGRLRWQTPSHTFMYMEYDQTVGELIFKNNTNAEIFRIGQTRTTAVPNAPRVSSNTTENITVSDHQRMVVLGSGSPITCNLSATATPGTTVRVIQRDVGVVTFAPASGALLRNRSSHTKTAGAGAVVTLEVYANSGGASAIWYLSGDTAA